MPAFGRSHKSIHVVWRQKALVSCTTALEKALFCNDRRIDAQSTHGKVVGGVARRAHARGVPVFAIVGDVGDDAYGAYDVGVSAIFSINRLAVPRDEAKARSHIDYTHTLDDLLRCIRAAEQFKR